MPTAKHGGTRDGAGRPRRSESGDLSKPRKIRATDAEHARWVARAAQLHVTLSDLIRIAVDQPALYRSMLANVSKDSESDT